VIKIIHFRKGVLQFQNEWNWGPYVTSFSYIEWRNILFLVCSFTFFLNNRSEKSVVWNLVSEVSPPSFPSFIPSIPQFFASKNMERWTRLCRFQFLQHQQIWSPLRPSSSVSFPRQYELWLIILIPKLLNKFSSSPKSMRMGENEFRLNGFRKSNWQFGNRTGEFALVSSWDKCLVWIIRFSGGIGRVGSVKSK